MLNWKDAVWRKSNNSGADNCVEVARIGDVIGIRDSKDPSGPVLQFNQAEVDAFMVGLASGEFRTTLGH